MEHLILGMVHVAEETEMQPLHISQYIHKCCSTDRARHPRHTTNGLEGEPYSSMNRGDDEVTDKGNQRA